MKRPTGRHYIQRDCMEHIALNGIWPSNPSLSNLRDSCRRVGGKNQKGWRIPREQDRLTYWARYICGHRDKNSMHRAYMGLYQVVNINIIAFRLVFYGTPQYESGPLILVLTLRALFLLLNCLVKSRYDVFSFILYFILSWLAIIS